MGVLNKYYPYSEKFKVETIIPNFCEYTRMVQSLSHQLRKEIKESYSAYHGDRVEGINFTFDMKHYVKNIADMEMDKIPVVEG